MRVLYFTEKDSPHDRRFLRALTKTDHQIFALRKKPCVPETPEGVCELSWLEGQPDWSNWRGWQRAKIQFIDLVNEIKPDLVHAGPIQGPALLAALAEFHPLVTMSWGSDILLRAKRSPGMCFATACTLEHSDVFLADCQAVADEALRYGFPAENIIQFPWGVDLAHFSPENGAVAGSELRRSLGWEDQFVILCNRTWSPLYGVDLLAEAFVGAVEENPNLRLLLVGGGIQAERIRQILKPVMDKVVMPGWLGEDDLPGVYCAADLFVSPSYSDGSSISLLEALACGRPVLVSDILGNREWVKPGEAGELFAAGDHQSLRKQLLKMAENPTLSQYGRRARVLAEARANWQKNFQQLLAGYALASQG